MYCIPGAPDVDSYSPQIIASISGVYVGQTFSGAVTLQQ